MLRVEIDMFSGRPNPVWIITQDDTVKKLIGAARDYRGGVIKPGGGHDGLGFREIRIENMLDDAAPLRGVPRAFAVGPTDRDNLEPAGALARLIIDTMPVKSDVVLVEHALTPLDAKLREVALQWLKLTERFVAEHHPRPRPPRPPRNPRISTTRDAKCDQCQYEISQFNPAFWNNAATQPYNNCYNYGRNWRTNTFAQPGRAHGAMTFTMACNTVTAAAMADGLVKRCKCLPQSEYPRRLMALVIAPGWDYHWYRHQRGGFWGHKPGGTAARNVDDNGVVITNPETCARGPYTNFCDYFYAGKSVVIN